MHIAAVCSGLRLTYPLISSQGFTLFHVDYSYTTLPSSFPVRKITITALAGFAVDGSHSLLSPSTGCLLFVYDSRQT